MPHGAFFQDVAYIFAAAMIGGLAAWRLRQPLILGYVLGGMLVGPFTPGVTISDPHGIEAFAEIGVILLMFSVGIEFHIRDLLRVKWVAILGGSAGIALSMLLGLAVALPLGLTPTQGVVIGAVISVASTMVLARLLIDRGELKTEHGRVMIAITLVEDLAVVILTVLLPNFGSLNAERVMTLAIALGKAVLVLAPIVFAAARLVPPLLARVARMHSSELFLLVIIVLCLGTAALTQAVGLSLALGAFVAGLLISGSDYAQESLGQLLPIRDAFVALFFVSIGMLINPAAVIGHLDLLGAMVLMVILGKAVIWMTVVKLFRYSIWVSMLVALGLTQIGEFSFILIQVARTSGLAGEDIYNATLATSLITILLNAGIVKWGSAWINRRRLKVDAARPHEEQSSELHGHVVLCGFGRIGTPAGAAFDTFKVPYLVVEIDPDAIQRARTHGVPCVLGDPAHLPVLQAAQVEKASLVIMTVPAVEGAYLAIKNIRKLNARSPIIARAHSRGGHELLMRAGATRVVQPEAEAAATVIAESLETMGIPRRETAEYLEKYREATELAQLRPAMREPIPELREMRVDEFGLAEKALRDSGLRQRLGLTVVSLRRISGQTIFNPPADTILHAGDVLQVLGTPRDSSEGAESVFSA